MTTTHTQHTPGPWRTIQSTDGVVVLNESALASGAASVVIVTPIRSEYEANARLIAAAPELLEALVHLVHACTANGVARCDSALANAKAVIAKANGNANLSSAGAEPKQAPKSPDLLSALKDALPELEATLESIPDEHSKSSLRYVIANARAAIAKATGKAKP